MKCHFLFSITGYKKETVPLFRLRVRGSIEAPLYPNLSPASGLQLPPVPRARDSQSAHEEKGMSH